MGRATFEGPVIAGDNRFGPLRNVGYAELYQFAALNLTNVTPATAGYAGGSASFVNSNNIPNSIGAVYTPSATAFPSALATITADNGTDNYRGWVCYVPAGSRIINLYAECIQVAIATSGTFSSANIYISNAFTANGGTATYGSILSTASTGKLTITFTTTQLTNALATPIDILQPNGGPNLSQIVFTLDLNGSSQSSTYTAGRYVFGLSYMQPDGNIGTATVYPFGNFD